MRLQDHIHAGNSGIRRGERRRAELETIGGGSKIEIECVESKLIGRCKPAGDRRLELRDKLLADIDEGESGTAQQPFQDATDVEIHVEGLDVHRYDADR